MPLDVVEYNLPDRVLFTESSDGYLVWQPDRYYLVLGMSNKPEGSHFTENVIRDRMPVTKRPSGGEAVMLTPSTIAFTVAKSFPMPVPFREFFCTVDGLVIECLGIKGIAGLGSKGISDITIGNKKILGSSMRSIHNRLIYHAVLNVSEEPGLFEVYIRHLRREPDYRSNRNHSEFVTSIREEGYNVSID